MPAPLEPIARLSRDLRAAAIALTDTEARYLVDAYYIMQEDRKRTRAQERALGENKEPHSVITWLAEQSKTLEQQITRALDVYTQAHLVGDWLRGVFGVGPVLAAGLLAHIDIKQASTVGHIWSYAGIAGDGQKPWQKGQKRPWNPTLKTICWRLSDSFVKFSNNQKCFYGQIYRQRKALEVEKNEHCEFKHIAEARLRRDRERGRSSVERPFHEAGKLSPGHLELRARRYAVKLFWRTCTTNGTGAPLARSRPSLIRLRISGTRI